MTSKYNERAYTARHETGHVLMMTLLGVGVRRVRILTGNKEFNGETIVTRRGRRMLNRQARRMVTSVDNGTVTCRAKFLVAIAGPLAGAMFAGEWPPGASLGPKAYRRILDHDEGDWKVIDADLSGQNLAETLKDRIIKAACVRVHEALQRNWQALDALAELLDQEGTLRSREVRRVLRKRFKVS